MKVLLTEIIRKECEQYRLIEFGLLNSVEEGVELLLSVLPISALEGEYSFDCFRMRREKALNRFYRRIRYADFLTLQKSRTGFDRFLFFFQQRLVSHLHSAYTLPTLDRELALPARTLAFKLSRTLAESYRNRLLLKIERLKSPHEMERCCRRLLQRRFPLGWSEVLTRLEKKDDDYWEEIYLWIKKLAGSVTSRLYPSIHYRKEIEQDTWADTSVFLQQKVVAGLLPSLENALHFRHYMLRVCVNKCHEAGRRNRMTDVVGETDDISGRLAEEKERDEEATETDQAGPMDFTDIDPRDQAAVSRALTAILWERTEPWYSRLTEGQEEKVRVLFLHYVSGKSYAEIAMMQTKALSAADFKRYQDKLRQDTVRIRSLLKQRFLCLLNTQKRK